MYSCRLRILIYSSEHEEHRKLRMFRGLLSLNMGIVGFVRLTIPFTTVATVCYQSKLQYLNRSKCVNSLDFLSFIHTGCKLTSGFE